MIIYTQILLIIFLIAFPIMFHVKKARIEFSLGLAIMFGISFFSKNAMIKNQEHKVSTLTISIAFIRVDGTWAKKI